MKQIWVVVLHLAVSSSLLGAISPVVGADEKQTKEVVQVLQAKDFWERAGRRDARKWSDEEVKQLRELATSSKDPTVRFRAKKILVDLAGNSRYPKADEAIVAAGFRSLEERLGKGSVKKLCLDQGFTHYTVSESGPDKWFLIEHVQSGGFNGGINLRWNEAKKAIVETKIWGHAVTD